LLPQDDCRLLAVEPFRVLLFLLLLLFLLAPQTLRPHLLLLV
jgi:hypothetical protein